MVRKVSEMVRNMTSFTGEVMMRRKNEHKQRNEWENNDKEMGSIVTKTA